MYCKFTLIFLRIRGTLMSFYDPFVNIGMLIAFLLGKYFTYADQAMYQMIWAVLFVILFARIPQTPGHLVNMEKQKVSRESETNKTIQVYHRTRYLCAGRKQSAYIFQRNRN